MPPDTFIIEFETTDLKGYWRYFDDKPTVTEAAECLTKARERNPHVNFRVVQRITLATS